MSEPHPVFPAGQQPRPPSSEPTSLPTPPSGRSFPAPAAFPASAPGFPGPAPGFPRPALPAPGAPPSAPTPWRDPLPPPGTEYHRFLRTPRNAWWKGLVAIVAFVVGYLLITTSVTLAAIVLDVLTGRATFQGIGAGKLEFTPALFLATNVGNALSIPLAMFLQWLIWGQPVRWLHSVSGYVRWRLLGRCAAIVVPIWAAYLLVSALVLPAVLGTSGPGSFTAESVAMLLIMLLTTPLQAAGEEYGARGLIMRAAGTWTSAPLPGLALAVVVPSLVFMVAHGAGDPWLNVYYFGFGAAMSILAWRTGGLEACVVVHAVNNVMAFGIVILAGQEINLDRSAGTGGPFMLLPLAVLAIVTAVLWLPRSLGAIQRTYYGAG